VSNETRTEAEQAVEKQNESTRYGYES
jgi:hypothetical protein